MTDVTWGLVAVAVGVVLLLFLVGQRDRGWLCWWWWRQRRAAARNSFLPERARQLDAAQIARPFERAQFELAVRRAYVPPADRRAPADRCATLHDRRRRGH